MILKNPAYEYALFKKKQLHLSEMLENASGIMNTLNAPHHVNTLNRLSKKTASDSFKVQIVGTFKNGKSTFINSFLGEEILPAYALPCTAVINEVKYGSTKRAVLHFKDPLPSVLPKELSPIAQKHMQRFGMKKIPPLEIPYDRIEDYVVIPIGKDPKEMLLESPYEKIELFWPLDLLKNGIEIIDSPGLNEHSTRTKVTTEYLSKADAILFVLNATSICTKDEIEFIKNNLFEHGFKDPFFIVNRYDLIPDAEKTQIRNYAVSKLKDFTGFGENGIFFLSARNAIDGKIERNYEKLQSSGLPLFEKRLSEFLINERGRMKLLQPTRELKRILYNESLFKIIPSQKAMLNNSAVEIKNKYAFIRPRLETLKKKSLIIKKHISNRIQQKENLYKNLFHASVQNLYTKIPIWINSFNPQTKLGILSQNIKAFTIVSEITEYLVAQLETEQNIWQSGVFSSTIQKDMATIFQDVEKELNCIFDEINKIQATLTGKSDTSAARRINDLFESITLEQYKFIISKDTSDTLVTGITNKATSLSALYVAECLHPQLMYNIIVNTLTTNRLGFSIYNIKNIIQAETINNLKQKEFTIANALENEIIKKYEEILHQLSRAVSVEINECEMQIINAINSIEGTDSKINSERMKIENCESEIKIIGMELDKLTFELD